MIPLFFASQFEEPYVRISTHHARRRQEPELPRRPRHARRRTLYVLYGFDKRKEETKKEKGEEKNQPSMRERKRDVEEKKTPNVGERTNKRKHVLSFSSSVASFRPQTPQLVPFGGQPVICLWRPRFGMVLWVKKGGRPRCEKKKIFKLFAFSFVVRFTFFPPSYSSLPHTPLRGETGGSRQELKRSKASLPRVLAHTSKPREREERRKREIFLHPSFSRLFFSFFFSFRLSEARECHRFFFFSTLFFHLEKREREERNLSLFFRARVSSP